ncbi:MAG: prephenate dehydrogenase [Micrococcales bacterium 73-13]|nr:MAG: prephenate dehydrogenase [Micrococcales bacterium 73-13]
MTARTQGPVRIVGAGLLGASIGHALTALGVDVVLADASRSAVSLAVDYGAGRAANAEDAPALVVVAVPPDVTAEVVAAELAAHPDAIVTDVASVKSAVLRELRAAGADLARYVGSHPMAGRERGGAVASRADLFIGRPWVIAAPEEAGPAWRVVEGLALDLGAAPVRMDALAHDEAVALVSHVPQLVASLLAKRLLGAPDAAVGLAGQGLRDTTRIAASDPALWVQILGANAPAVAALLADYRADLDAAIEALAEPSAAGARRSIAELIAAGGAGVARIPGKHGSSRSFASVTVLIDDRPGELARLLTEIGALGVNLEDLRLEHSPGAQVGIAEIAVLPEVEARLVADLTAAGWRIGAAE